MKKEVVKEVTVTLLLISMVTLASNIRLAEAINVADDHSTIKKGISLEEQLSMVYVLEDNDPDYSNPPFEDRLTIIDPSTHAKVKNVSQFNICETIGGWKLIAAVDEGQAVIIGEIVPERLLKYDAMGNEVFSIDIGIQAVDVSNDNRIYGLTDGTIYGDKVLILDTNGTILKEASYGGVDIVVDDYSNSVWIVGADIKKLDKSLTFEFSIDPIAWCAVSVDFTSKGDVWVAERYYSGSIGRLLRISPDGNITKTIELGSTPCCLSVNRNDDSFWVALSGGSGRGLYKYSDDGQMVLQVESTNRWSVKVNQTDGSVWVAGFGDVKHYSATGGLISSIPGFSSRQAYVTLFSTLVPAPAPSTRYPWSMFHHDLKHTGYTESPVPNTNRTQWTYTTGDVVNSSAAVVDGKVYVGSHNAKVYCLNALTGAHIWNYTTGGGVESSPAVVDGKVYVGSRDHKVYCLNASTGTYIWDYPTGSILFSSPAVVDGKVYVGSRDRNVYCLDASSGAYIWSYPTGNALDSSPAIVDGKVYFGSRDCNVYCLDALTGAHVWDRSISGPGLSSPAVAGGNVYVGGRPGMVDCLSASTGAHIWFYHTTGYRVDSSPAVADGVVYIGSDDGKVYAIGDVIRFPEDGHPGLQDAINAANPRATISIAVGVYHQSVILNKPLTILGRKGSAPIFDGGGSGIAVTILSSASGSTVTGIAITSWDQGMLVNDASNCTIYDNIISLMGTCGIGIEGTNAVNNQIYSNIFQENTVAIDFSDSSTTNIIHKNIITLNTVGLNLKSDGNIIYANTISDNDVGIDVTDSANNVIYHNNFANRIENAMSGDLYNIWDNGYPSGGNYWSDYAGIDEKSGPSQNVVGSDGIGDTEYTINGDNVDRYPLIQPFNRHDIGIVNIITKTVVGQGFPLRIDVKILNYGLYDEAFTVTAYANTMVIGTATMILTKRNYAIITFFWDTSPYSKGNYVISAEAAAVPDETDTLDNTLPDGLVLVTIRGDINGDHTVNYLDGILLGVSFNSDPSKPAWNPNADINGDNFINFLDAIILGSKFGQGWT